MERHYLALQAVVTMANGSASFRAEMARIKRELAVLRKLSVHVGIMGDADSDIVTIAGVHEYGATIHAKNVKHLAIPLTQEAKGAKSPKEFNDLRYIPISAGYGFLVRDKKQHKARTEKASTGHKPETHKARSGGKDPRPNDDYEWMYMLVESVTIPERSFIRASYDTGKDRLSELCAEAVTNIIRKGWSAQDAADYVGAWAVEVTRQYFNTQLTSPQKSKTTMLTNNQDQLLYDKGRLYGSITYRVEGGEQK